MNRRSLLSAAPAAPTLAMIMPLQRTSNQPAVLWFDCRVEHIAFTLRPVPLAGGSVRWVAEKGILE